MIDPEKRDAIDALSQAGWPSRKIARTLGLPETTVRRHRVEPSTDPGGKPRDYDHRVIIALANDGYTSGEIAEIVGCEIGTATKICDGSQLAREQAGGSGRYSGPTTTRTFHILRALTEGQTAREISEEHRVTVQRVYQVRTAAIEAGLIDGLR